MEDAFIAIVEEARNHAHTAAAGAVA
jgi:hypothetical protein